MLEQLRKKRQQDAGFTLVELLIVIVIIGILAAVVVLAVGGITDSGESAACDGSKDAASAAAVAYYAASPTNDWPTVFTDLTTPVAPATQPLLKLSSGVAPGATADEVVGKGWTLTMEADGEFTCTPTCF